MMCNLVSSFLMVATVVVHLVSTNDYTQSNVNQQTPAFTKYESFLDIFPLTGDNFTTSVLEHPDPWVVIFHKGMLEREWKSMAVSLRGVIWVGMIDTQTNQELLKKISYDAKTEGTARVYKYGTKKSKKKTWRAVSDATTARVTAVNSIPDLVLSITMKDIEDMLMDSFVSSPSRFPVIFLTEEGDSSALMKAMSSRFKKYYNFAKMVNPALQDLEKIGIGKLFNEMPTLIVLVIKPKGTGFHAIPYNKKVHGDFIYPNILAFLYSVNREYRHQLPGENHSEIREAVEMEDVIEVEARRFDVQGLKQEGRPRTVIYDNVHVQTSHSGVNHEEL